MKQLYNYILQAKANKQKLLAVLLDPDKLETIKGLIIKINNSPATHIFVGGSTFNSDYKQVSNLADGILFLSLLSGINSDYLIEHQVNAVPILEKSKLEAISTAYLLIKAGTETAVERESDAKPLDRTNVNYVCQTAKAGEYLGSKLVYLEDGSGAKLSIPLEMISQVSKKIRIPLIVGGGIRSKKAIDEAFSAGADMVVIGTAFENDNTFFESC